MTPCCSPPYVPPTPETHPTACWCENRTGEWILGFDCGCPEIVHTLCGGYLAEEWWERADVTGATPVTVAQKAWYVFSATGDPFDCGYGLLLTPTHLPVNDECPAYLCACGGTDITWTLSMANGGITLLHEPCGRSPAAPNWESGASTKTNIPVHVTFPRTDGDRIRIAVVARS